MSEENSIKEENNSMVFKTLKKVERTNKGGKDKKLTESRDTLKALRKYTREKNIDNTVMKRKIEMAWIFVKETFAKIASQRRNHKYLLMIYEKGTLEIKKEFLDTTLKEIVDVSYSEHGKGLVLYLYNANEYNKGKIIESIKQNIRPLITNLVALSLVDELYNLNKTEKRGGFGAVALAYVDGRKEEDIDVTKEEEVEDITKKDDEDIKREEKADEATSDEDVDHVAKEQIKDITNHDVEDTTNEQVNDATREEEVDTTTKMAFEKTKFYKAIFPRHIFKLFDRKLLSFEIVHEILYHYFMKNKEMINHFYGLIMRNKQFKYLLLTHKGLEVSLEVIKRDEKNILNYMDFFRPDFVTIVNNKYGVVFILKVLEINNPEFNRVIVEEYIKNYKSVFVSEESIYPLIYLFNQEKKHFSTLFNHHRSKVMVEVDRSSYIEDLRNMILENLEVFVSSFCYPIVFWIAKKDQETNKRIKKYFKGIEINNPFTEKLHKKLLKYKVIK